MSTKLDQCMRQRGLTDTALAAAVGKHRSHISRVRRALDLPSPALAKQIEQQLGGAVTRSDLRPDIWTPFQYTPVEKSPAAVNQLSTGNPA